LTSIISKFCSSSKISKCFFITIAFSCKTSAFYFAFGISHLCCLLKILLVMRKLAQSKYVFLWPLSRYLVKNWMPESESLFSWRPCLKFNIPFENWASTDALKCVSIWSGLEPNAIPF
jgi:hypothetical protein